MADNPSSTRAIVKAIKDLILDRMESIEECFDDFPNANQKLKFPSASVFTQSPKFTPRQVYLVRDLGEITANEDPNKGKHKILYCIGSEDFKFNIDFWCESKFQRHDIYEEFKSAFSELEPNAGINVKLTEYYDEYIHLSFSDLSFEKDSEISAQRGEWRLTVDVTTNVRAMKVKLENMIEEIEQTVETSEGEGFEDDSSGTDYLNNTI